MKTDHSTCLLIVTAQKLKSTLAFKLVYDCYVTILTSYDCNSVTFWTVILSYKLLVTKDEKSY